ncbi:hypothetical protein QR680_016887 [Steinernema hermaphroditum]|uniref:Uncharacterized protein n=1 Tax=Steinernema hermaphroditum TaxID=289476 RepID=A0AA39LN24_9BILA|nr:hypothetical protein QR680_016887 [Steinernema hermaphroditum]
MGVNSSGAPLSDLKAVGVIYVSYVIYFEILLHLCSPLVNGYFLFLLRRPFFHLNLRILLGQFSVTLTLLSLIRLILVFNNFFGGFVGKVPLHIINFLNESCKYGTMDITVLFATERIFATYRAEKYEKMKGTLWMWMVNPIMAYYIYRNLRQKQKTYSGVLTATKENDRVVIILTVLVLANIVGLAVFFFVRKYNQKRWDTEVKQKLSHRYQIVENIRTAKQLLIVLLLSFLLSGFFYVAMMYMLFTDDGRMPGIILLQLFEILAALLANIIPLFFVRTHPRMWSVVKRQFLRRVKKVNSAKEKRPKAIRRSESVVMGETEMYFKHLKNVWN